MNLISISLLQMDVKNRTPDWICVESDPNFALFSPLNKTPVIVVGSVRLHMLVFVRILMNIIKFSALVKAYGDM